MNTVLEIWIVATVFGAFCCDWVLTNIEKFDQENLTEKQKESRNNAIFYAVKVKEFKETETASYFLLLLLVNTVIFYPSIFMAIQTALSSRIKSDN